MRVPALRALINIVSGNDQQTQVVIDVGGLRVIRNLLEDPFETVRKEAALIVSNIVAGNLEQIQVYSLCTIGVARC